MIRVNIVMLCCLSYISFVSTHKQPKSPCDTSVKNALIEHFFNIIFTEFHSTPPVCVCVQMCAGQSTYCYPNGCLKRDELKRVDSPQTLSQNLKKYAFVVEEKNNFMKDYLERKNLDESNIVSTGREGVVGMLPGIFNDIYSNLGKYKKVPNVELKYNFREQVRNKKSDLLKIDTADFSKSRWPMNKHNHVSGRKSSTSRPPLVGKANFFMSMLPATDYAEYPPKYFKRDLTKFVDGDDINVKTFYLLEKLYNDTETISLETLINNLIKNSFTTKSGEMINETESKVEKEHMENVTKIATNDIDKTTNHTSNLTSNINDDYVKQEINKYNDSVLSSTNKFNGMITNLSKHIEKQNNTSMEIAKRIVGDFKAEDITMKTTPELMMQTSSVFTENIVEMETMAESTTTTIYQDKMVTKKIRQKKARKLHRKQLY